jgi:hypothetical protein
MQANPGDVMIHVAGLDIFAHTFCTHNTTSGELGTVNVLVNVLSKNKNKIVHKRAPISFQLLLANSLPSNRYKPAQWQNATNNDTVGTREQEPDQA